MMIPSDLHDSRGRVDSGNNGHYGDVPSVLQHAEQLMRSQMPGQTQHQAQDQLQMLHNLQQIGRKQKEEQSKMLSESAESAKREVPALMQELQLNILHQTHLMQAGDKAKSSGLLQQLQGKQQQLMAQLQLAQHAITLSMLVQGRDGKDEQRNRHRSDTYSSDGSLKENQSDNTSPPVRLNGNRGSSEEATPVKREEEDRDGLYSNGQCKWPGCEKECDSDMAWRSHLHREHMLNDKSTAQARVQMQIVSQLELQLRKEKERLTAMMKHLHPDKLDKMDRDSPEPKRLRIDSPPVSLPNLPKMTVPELLKSSPMPNLPQLSQYSNPLAHLMNLTPSSPMSSPLAALSSSTPLGSPHTPTSASIRSSLHEKSSMAGYSPTILPDTHRRRVTHHDRGNPNLDPEEDLAKNREFYRVQDVRPPYTYAALIRQAILETPYQQLTLHDIYSWFTTTFCYFRRNAASWKNAVRHNLSLHKCFKRVENVKGAVWTVDDLEYHKKRNPKGNNQWTSALEGPNMMSSPSLYEGAFRLETTGRASDLFPHSSLMMPQGNLKQESMGEQEESPLSSPLGESYKIHIGPKESHSPQSLRDEEMGDDPRMKMEDNIAQDLSVGASVPLSLVPGSHSGLSSPHSNNSYNPMKMDEERREDERGDNDSNH